MGDVQVAAAESRVAGHGECEAHHEQGRDRRHEERLEQAARVEAQNEHVAAERVQAGHLRRPRG